MAKRGSKVYVRAYLPKIAESILLKVLDEAMVALVKANKVCMYVCMLDWIDP